MSAPDVSQPQAIKFRNFQDQVRIANLHNQQLHKSVSDDEQLAAQQAAEDYQREAFGDAGGTINTQPNDPTSIMQHLRTETAANCTVSIQPGTHISANGKDILVPSSDPESLGAQVKLYQSLQGVLPGLPSLPPRADPSSIKKDVNNMREELGNHLDIMTYMLQGYSNDGVAYTHAQLNDIIPAYESQIDNLKKNGINTAAAEYQLKTLQNTLNILQANEVHHTSVENAVASAVAGRFTTLDQMQ